MTLLSQVHGSMRCVMSLRLLWRSLKTQYGSQPRLGRFNGSTAVASPFPILSLPPLPPSSSNQKAIDENLSLFSHVVDQREKVWSVDTKIASQDRSGRKLTVGERLRLLVDPGSEVLEIGTLAGLNMPYGDVNHGNNIVCVVRVCGEVCLVSANDWTFKGGTAYPISVKKQLRAQEIAMANRLPCIYFVDSGGAFLPLQVHTMSMFITL